MTEPPSVAFPSLVLRSPSSRARRSSPRAPCSTSPRGTQHLIIRDRLGGSVHFLTYFSTSLTHSHPFSGQLHESSRSLAASGSRPEERRVGNECVSTGRSRW